MKLEKGVSLNIMKQGYLPAKSAYAFMYNIRQFFRNIKFAIQRIKYGYSERDYWDLDNYHSMLMYFILRDLADNTHGYPGKDQFVDQVIDGKEISGYEIWQNYLYEIAEHFKNTLEDVEDVPINKEIDACWKKMDSYFLSYDFDKGVAIETYSDEKAYNKAREEWLAKEKEAGDFRLKEIKTALNMLNEHYFSLWD